MYMPECSCGGLRLISGILLFSDIYIYILAGPFTETEAYELVSRINQQAPRICPCPCQQY